MGPGTRTLDDRKYDLAEGRIFLVSMADDSRKVQQLKRDTIATSTIDRKIREFAQEQEVAAFFWNRNRGRKIVQTPSHRWRQKQSRERVAKCLDGPVKSWVRASLVSPCGPAPRPTTADGKGPQGSWADGGRIRHFLPGSNRCARADGYFEHLRGCRSRFQIASGRTPASRQPTRGCGGPVRSNSGRFAGCSTPPRRRGTWPGTYRTP